MFDARELEARRYLAALADRLGEKGLRVRTALRFGSPAAEIVKTADEEDADLIAMSTHGRSGPGRALGREIDRNAFAAAFLTFLDRWLTTYQEVGEAPVLRAWRDRDILTGRRVEVRDGAVPLDGRAVGVDADGDLQVLDSRGRVFRVLAGEVRIVE